MTENILIKAASDFSDAFRSVDRFEARIDRLANKKLEVTARLNLQAFEAQVRDAVGYAERAFEKLGRGTGAKSSLITNIFNAKDVEAEIKKIESAAARLRGAGPRPTGFNPQRSDDQIEERLRKANTSFQALEKSASSLEARLRPLKNLAQGFQQQISQAEKNLARAEKTRADFAGKIGRAENNNREVKPAWVEGLASATENVANLKQQISQVSTSYQNLQNLMTKPQKAGMLSDVDRLNNFRGEQGGIKDEIKRLEEIKKANDGLVKSYTNLGNAGKGIEVAQSGLQEQLGIVNELIRSSELYNENERTRIDLFKAQQRILQGSKALTSDLIKANRELYEAPARIVSRGLPNTPDANGREAPVGFQSAADLIQQFGNGTGLREGQLINTSAGIENTIAELKEAQKNVDIFGDKFRALGFIIEQLDGRLKPALEAPIIQAGNAADELIQKLKVLQGNGITDADRRSRDRRQINFSDGTYRGRGGSEDVSIPREIQSRAGRGGAIIPYDASYAIQQTRELITLLDRVGAYTPPVGELKGLSQIASGIGQDRKIQFEPNPEALASYNAVPKGSEIIPFDPDYAKRQQAIQEEIELTQRLAKERNKLANQLKSRQESANFSVQAGTIDEIERLAGSVQGIPADIELVIKAAKDLAPGFREGSEEAERLAAVIKNLSEQKSSPFFDLKSLDSYSGKIAELKRQIGSSEIGSETFSAASRELGFTNLERLDQSGAGFQEERLGEVDYFKNLEREAGSAQEAIRNIFADFGSSTAGIEAAASKLGTIRNALPFTEVEAFDAAVRSAAESLGIAGERGLRAFNSTGEAARRSEADAKRYAATLYEVRSGIPVSPENISSARSRAGDLLAKAIPGSADARNALGSLNDIDFSSTIGNLQNLEAKAQELAKVNTEGGFVDFLKRVADQAKNLPGIFSQVKSEILSLEDTFNASSGPQRDEFNQFAETLRSSANGKLGVEGVPADGGSLKTYNDAVAKSKELAEKAEVGTTDFSEAIAKLATNTRIASKAQQEFNKVLSEDSAQEAAQNLKELQDSGLGVEDFINQQFEGTPFNRSGLDARIQAVREQFGDLDFSMPGLEMFQGDMQQALANFQQQLDSISFQNIESDLLDLGQLFKDVFSRGLDGNQPGLIAAGLQGGPAGLKQRAAALSPGSRRGLSEALIGGGFPLLFGQGPLAAGGGLAGGLIGPALLGGGGGFSGSIIGTALGSGLENLSTSATELSKALIDPVANLEQLGDASLIASTGVQGLVKALAGQGKGAEAAAALEAELSKNPTLATVRDQEAFRQNNPLLRGLSNAKATGELQVGNAIKQGLAAGSTLIGLVAGGGSAIGNALIPGQKQKNDDRVARFEELGELAKKARDASDSLSILAAGAEGLPLALGERRGILAKIAEGESGVQETRSQLEQEQSRPPELRNLEKIAELEQELIQKQKERTVESQKSLASANARLSVSQRELALEQKLSGSSGAGTDALRAFETSRFNSEGAIQAEKLALQDITKLEQELAALRSTYGYSSDKEKELNISLSGAREALAIAQEQQAIEKKITLERVNQAKLVAQSSRRDLDFARFTAGLAGADLENAGDDRQLAEARREYGEIAAAVNLAPQSEELRLNLEAAANRLEQAGIAVADNITAAAGEAAQRLITGLIADNSLSDALAGRNAIRDLRPGTARGAIEGSGIVTGAQNSILSSGQNLLGTATELQKARERAAFSGGEVSPQFEADVLNSGKSFAETVIRAGNDIALSLNSAKSGLADSSNTAGRAILDPRARDIFGGTQRQIETAAPLIEKAFQINIDRFTKAFGSSPYPRGGEPLTLGGRADASDIISDLVSKIEQVQQSQALVTALTDGAASIQSSASNVLEGLNALSSKNWEVNVLVNGQAQPVNLG